MRPVSGSNRQRARASRAAGPGPRQPSSADTGPARTGVCTAARQSRRETRLVGGAVRGGDGRKVREVHRRVRHEDGLLLGVGGDGENLVELCDGDGRLLEDRAELGVDIDELDACSQRAGRKGWMRATGHPPSPRPGGHVPRSRQGGDRSRTRRGRERASRFASGSPSWVAARFDLWRGGRGRSKAKEGTRNGQRDIFRGRKGWAA